jgi:Na+-transporting methylmalonyl-CoA/oxaloacetate decarboxylase gamma subunit
LGLGCVFAGLVILICKKYFMHMIIAAIIMSDVEIHAKAAREKRLAALDEYGKKRYMVVGDLAIKTVEQAIEALAALEGKHFHLLPRSAHSNRVRWIKERFPSLSKDVDELWGAYGALGYEGIDGERAEKAIAAMERVLDEIGKEARVRFK